MRPRLPAEGGAPGRARAGRVLGRLKDAACAYGDRRSLGHGKVELGRGDKIAIVGANGAGKTTLLRMIAGQLEPKTGWRAQYQFTKLSYFVQHAA